ncbi:MAG TPA: cyclic nucleotide-binding domain-containing protein [Actinomycetota bacterium]|nr:cyclic nucleotide-binding domain-containing protein [Actinomycetota bacterium]
MDEHRLEIGALRQMPFFADLGDDDLGEVVRIGTHQHFESGEEIVVQGDAGDGMYIVLEGRAQVDVGGRFHNLEPGAFVGEMALIRKRKRSATVKAIEPVTALKVSAEDFHAFLMAHPGVAVAMLGAVIDRLNEVQERVDAWMA